MMGGETFILLKVGLLGPTSAKQAETRMAVLPTILSICPQKFPRRARKYLSGLYCRRFPPHMANSAGFADSVIQITVLAGISAHNPAWEGG
jgi:hypothetical protein